LIVRRHSGIKHEVLVIVVSLRRQAPRRAWRQGRRPSTGRVGHIFITFEQEKSIAVIGGLAPGISGEQVFKVATDRGACRCRGAGEEFGIDLSVEVDDDAVKIEREEVSAQEAARVDDGVPGLADGAGRGEPAWLETAEHFGEHVVGQEPRQVVVVPLLAMVLKGRPSGPALN
jgi:hypothetical protein